MEDLIDDETSKEDSSETDRMDFSDIISEKYNGLEGAELLEKVHLLQKSLKKCVKYVDKVKEDKKKKENEWNDYKIRIKSRDDTRKLAIKNLLDTKESHIEELIRYNQQKESEQISELHVVINNQSETIVQLEKQVERLQIELVDCQKLNAVRDEKGKLKRSQKLNIALDLDERQEMEELKQKYFFSLALNIKLNMKIGDLDVNSMYTRVRKESIPVNDWELWILDHIDDPDSRF
eukprot:TRINITY_DN8467_c0_g1_i1.p1 TRINITY_DN8467_c0_g1~~TRINITY_DN8467_c0_g1_i1.p1  ORF type:complete len:235 (-),score=68.52 TRINITY_DN8467_c0_g1_i1:98-802(-)